MRDKEPRGLSPRHHHRNAETSPAAPLDDATIHAIQGEIALRRLSHGQIARRYGVEKAVVGRIARGKIRTAGQASPRDAIRQLQAWREQLVEPLGVFCQAPGAPEDADEAELECDGAPARLDRVRRAKLVARRRDRVVRGDPEAGIPAEKG